MEVELFAEMAARVKENVEVVAVKDNNPTQEERRIRLARRFRRQQSFSQDNSPLTACLCGLIAKRMAPEAGDNPLCTWLLEASRDCASFAVPMLLMASLHRKILEHNPGFAELAAYFPTVGGRKTCDADIGTLLEQVILTHRRQLAEFIQCGRVQTNETGRGLCWLLPLCYLPWQEVTLIELGCSAGLNLIADQRYYVLRDMQSTRPDFVVGGGHPPQFVVNAKGTFISPESCLPQIRTRLGCDLHPFFLTNEDDELTLASFVWGDQADRLRRLREGIATLQAVQTSGAPIHLFQANLPNDLPRFLQQCSPIHSPTVIFNTYLLPYLKDKGRSLRTSLQQWAVQQAHPVLWLQWELMHQGPEPPETGWLGWTAELWAEGTHHFWQLAWVHPHGLEVQWCSGLASWAEFCHSSRS